MTEVHNRFAEIEQPEIIERRFGFDDGRQVFFGEIAGQHQTMNSLQKINKLIFALR